MMACGKKVIATNYSAHTEFCNKDNTLLVDIEKLEPAYDGVFFSGACGQWANIGDPQKEQIVNHMRSVHVNKKENHLCLNEEGIKTAIHFSWENSAKEVINGL